MSLGHTQCCFARQGGLIMSQSSFATDVSEVLGCVGNVTKIHRVFADALLELRAGGVPAPTTHSTSKQSRAEQVHFYLHFKAGPSDSPHPSFADPVKCSQCAL